MDYLTIIIASAAALGFIGLAWLGGYELGQAHGIDAERDLADRRIKPLLKKLNELERLGLGKRRARK
jgi:hypothetical protein